MLWLDSIPNQIGSGLCNNTAGYPVPSCAPLGASKRSRVSAPSKQFMVRVDRAVGSGCHRVLCFAPTNAIVCPVTSYLAIRRATRNRLTWGEALALLANPIKHPRDPKEPAGGCLVGLVTRPRVPSEPAGWVVLRSIPRSFARLLCIRN